MKRIYSVFLSLVIFSCCSTVQKDPDRDSFIVPEKYNFKFTGYDINIDNPDNDRRSYYKIFINKVEEGRTTTGLESQTKIFETKLPENRHVLKVQKWVLDPGKGKYVKLNNIDQPKPDYIYFKIESDKILFIKMETDSNGKTKFIREFMKE